MTVAVNRSSSARSYAAQKKPASPTNLPSPRHRPSTGGRAAANPRHNSPGTNPPVAVAAAAQHLAGERGAGTTGGARGVETDIPEALAGRGVVW